MEPQAALVLDKGNQVGHTRIPAIGMGWAVVGGGPGDDGDGGDHEQADDRHSEGRRSPGGEVS